MKVITPKQMECLRALAMFSHTSLREPVASEVAEMAGKVRYWATGKLNSLERMGLARRGGSVPPWTWRITDAGKDALSA